MEQGNNKKIWWIVLTILGLLAAAFWAFNWRSLPPYTYYMSPEKINQNELSSIEKDLNLTDTAALDSDLVSLEAEVNAEK